VTLVCQQSAPVVGEGALDPRPKNNEGGDVTDEEAKELRRTAELNCAGVKDTCRLVIAALDDRQRYRTALERIANNETTDWWWYVGIARTALTASEDDKEAK
jgi:hypothetical protein